MVSVAVEIAGGAKVLEAGSQLSAAVRVALDAPQAAEALSVMVGWSLLGEPEQLFMERTLRSGAWEAGEDEVRFECALPEGPTAARDEPGVVWFIAARLRGVEQRAYFRLSPRGEGALAPTPRRELEQAVEDPGRFDRQITVGAGVLITLALIGFGAAQRDPLFIVLAALAAAGTRLMARERPGGPTGTSGLGAFALEVSPLEVSPGEALTVTVSFVAREAVVVRAVQASLSCVELRLEIPKPWEERGRSERLVSSPRGQWRAAVSGARRLAAGEGFEGTTRLEVPPGALASSDDGMGIVWRCAVRVELEGRVACEEETLVRVRRRIGASAEEEAGAPRGGGW